MSITLPFVSDIRLQQQATFSRKIKWVKKSDGSPVIDLNDFNAKMTIRPISPSKGTVLVLTNDNGGLVLDAVEGSVTINITSAQTGAMTQADKTPRYAEFDLYLYPKVGTEPVYALARGEVDVLSAVTEL